MNYTIYFILAILDVLAVFSIMFKIFRFPFIEYFKEILLVSISSAILSVIIRFGINADQLEPIAQTLFFALFLRLVIKVRIKYSLLLSVSGFLGFALFQFSSVTFYTATGLINTSELQGNFGSKVFLTQLTTQLLSFGFAILLKKKNYGYSKIPRPPHDMLISDKRLSLNTWNVMIISLGILTLGSSAFVVSHFISYYIFLLLAIIFIFVSLLRMSRSREITYDRKTSRENSDINKKC